MRILTIVLLLALAPFFGQAQNTVTGKIVDELGLPIYLASIALEGTDIVAHTDYDGSFSLNSNKDFHWKIQISSSGFKPETYFVLDGGRTEDIVLEYSEDFMEMLLDTKENATLDQKPDGTGKN